jgi:Fuc2NAc and GlcNAc transferase
MGDVGSGFLGYAFAVLALTASRTTSTPLLAWLVLGGVFVVDATLTLLRRMMRGERWFAAHRLHAYQRASRYLESHRAVTLAAAAMNVGLAVCAVVVVLTPKLALVAAAIAVMALLATYVWVERRSPMFAPASQ